MLSNFLKSQSLSSRLTYGRALPVETAVGAIAARAQTNTQHYGKRPYGVGLLIAGVDETGPHLFEFMPSGMTQEMLACAIGARSQMARTYLERNAEYFMDSSREDLVGHGLSALKESLAQDKELTVENCSVGLVGIGPDGKTQNFKLYDGQEVKEWIGMVAADAAAQTEDAPAAADSMDVDN